MNRHSLTDCHPASGPCAAFSTDSAAANRVFNADPRAAHGVPVLTLLLPALLFLAGCGGAPANVGRVTGLITLDGKPLPGATVTFSPSQGGVASLGTTDAEGRYDLNYAGAVRGAEIGQHQVKISTFVRGDPEGDPPTPGAKEQVPLKYNLRSELVAEVKAGDNSLDFPLKLDGQVVQPDQIPMEE